MRKSKGVETQGYLFVHFTGEWEDGEQIYFALSQDGLHWTDLKGGLPVLRSDLGEKGVRDPFIVRSPKEDKFYLIATDLKMNGDKTWQEAKTTGSRDIIVWESENLVDWSLPWSVKVGIESAGCVWAPEAIYDETADNFFVFWASNTKEGTEDYKQKIYAARTENFREFTMTEKYMEKENHIIDTTIFYHKGMYYRFSKDETAKNICMEKGSSLNPDAFIPINAPLLKGLTGVEGPEIFQFNDKEEWCLIVDRYEKKEGYLPLVTSDLSKGAYHILAEEEFDFGNTVKRHGGIIGITKEEFERLKAFYQ